MDNLIVSDDLREWVNRTLPTVTDWDGVERGAAQERGLVWLHTQPAGPLSGKGVTVSPRRCRALLAGLDEIVAKLSDDAVTELIDIVAGDGYCSILDVADLCDHGLVIVDDASAAQATLLGRGIAQKLVKAHYRVRVAQEQMSVRTTFDPRKGVKTKFVDAEVKDEHDALKVAIETAKESPCMKSKRGAVLWDRQTGYYVTGFNTPPLPFVCSGDDACRQACNKVCIHAEAHCIALWLLHQHRSEAIWVLGVGDRNLELPLEMLHVKVVNGQPVASGPPSCWQCSRLILTAGISGMWLLHAEGLKRYTPEFFHELTLMANGLPRKKK